MCGSSRHRGNITASWLGLAASKAGYGEKHNAANRRAAVQTRAQPAHRVGAGVQQAGKALLQLLWGHGVVIILTLFGTLQDGLARDAGL
jgi:hypothetical protein